MKKQDSDILQSLPSSKQTLCPVDKRIKDFLDNYLSDIDDREPFEIPSNTLIMDRPGLSRTLSLPPDKDIFESDIVSSYRLHQGVLHNPKNDRRTTQGVFHICEGGLAIPDDKVSVPKTVFAKLLAQAFKAPSTLMSLPYTSTQSAPKETFVSTLLRPTVCPEVPGVISKKSLEVRFFAPGNLVGNLDFVETIFGNAGNPYLPENDSALDTEHWTGHTGCVILAPHLSSLKKKDLGLPSYDEATPRQRRDGICWKSADEIYNNGQAFKITCRDTRGIIVTLIADNYFGYCKKEVKTQISYAANLYGLCEEEHSGGAIAFSAYDLGDEFELSQFFSRSTNTFEDTKKLYGSFMDLKPEGYGVDKKYPDIILVPEDSKFNLQDSSVSWTQGKREQKIKLLAGHNYVLPSGYKVHMKKQTGGYTWHLIGTVADGVLCHKPCTVSGGGKSEISKSIIDAMIQGPVFTANFQKDMQIIDELLEKNYAFRFKSEFLRNKPSRPILSSKRSLGSVIKLFTVSEEYTDEYNAWLESIADYIKEIVFAVKRFYHPEWANNWKKYFSVDIVNGQMGHELKFNNRKLIANYLRIGRQQDGSWRLFRVRPDYAACDKIQVADDITASVVLPKNCLEYLDNDYPNPSVKLITNCETFLFQRPDDAIYRGYDKQAEADIATDNTFLSNFEALTVSDVKQLTEDAVHFDQYTACMQKLLTDFVRENKPGSYVVSSSHPRMVGGKPSKNPRYLQYRPDLANPRKKHLADIGARLFRRIPSDKPVLWPVNAVLPGRRNNAPDVKNDVPALAVYNPLHYQELPELFMDFICSLTGKSPSTTGFGSEGALTKGPFNALWPIVDLNNSLISFIVSGYHAFSSAAGVIGPNYKVDHDISLLVPEIWSRMRPEEQAPDYLIKNGFLSKLQDFEYNGKMVRASILGYRITSRFVNTFMGRIFSNPSIVFNEQMLMPEKQDLKTYVEGVENIIETQKRVAEHYFADQSVEAACPPLKALLHIMKHDHFEGKSLEHPDVRALFTRTAMIKSDWYQKRLLTQRDRDAQLCEKHIRNLESFLSEKINADKSRDLNITEKLKKAKALLSEIQTESYLKRLEGTIGADALDGQNVHVPTMREYSEKL